MRMFTIVLGGFAFITSTFAADRCDPGYYLLDGECTRPPAGHVSKGGTSTTYTACAHTSYANEDQTQCLPCPDEYPSAGYAVTSINGCHRICSGGTYMASVNDTFCTTVTADYWAPMATYKYGHDATTDGTLHRCPEGTQTQGTSGYGADDKTDCARVLHIGDYTMRMTGLKRTSPALGILMNGDKYWARLSSTIQNMSATSAGHLNILYKGTQYYAFDDTIQTGESYPWEAEDFDWSENGTYSYDKDAQTWIVNFSHSTWSGIAECTDTSICYCTMLSPALTSQYHRVTPSVNTDCVGKCALECGWGFATTASYRQALIKLVIE